MGISLFRENTGEIIFLFKFEGDKILLGQPAGERGKQMKMEKKRKQYLRFGVIIITILLFAGAVVWPFVFPIEVTRSFLPYEYTIHGTYIEINRYTGEEEEVVIPDRIWFRPVKALKLQYPERLSGLFKDNDIVKTVYMPDTIEQMDEYTFYNCTNLETVRLSGALRRISDDAFGECSSLKSIEIPEGVEVIDIFAFSDCSNLEEVSFPESLQEIRVSAFSYCKKLEHIEIPPGVQKIGGDTFEGTAWMEKQKEEFVIAGNHVLIAYQGKEETVEVPEGIEYVGAYVFGEYPELKQLILPASLQECSSHMVAWGCANLETVIINNPDMVFADDFLGVAFEYCSPDLTLIGESGSTAEKYAEQWGYHFSEKIPEE